MPTSGRNEDGLSEIIGFVLILGLIVVASTLYLLYVVPAEGREDEIVHMNQVKDLFVDYKGTLDSLWMNSISNLTDHRLAGTMISTSFDLGTAGGNTQAGGVFLSFMKPQGSPALMSVGQPNLDGTLRVIGSQTDTNGTVTTPLDVSIPMGSMSYQTQNNYWIQQTYYYQMGGVFLNQSDGVSIVSAPAISVYNVTVSVNETTKYIMPKVSIAGLKIQGRGSIGGTGPLRVDTRLTENLVDTTNKQYSNVTVIAVMNSPTAAQLWDKAFRNAGRQMSLQYNNISFISPGGTFNNTPINDKTAIMNIKAGSNAADPNDPYHVYLDLTQAEYRVTLQNVGQ
ncbi:hypothetical protein [Methanosphaerula palustris]|uniref:Uncharacterized protein n=1 Tax=Methanosphaerula palustris (strain ATCC BAA-1556 / DSM 19958 / E1-9c) TaxID=521011 RepID=B8GIE6_METPE|nr:hypothetical protein [Methanosphaerula palustris]ACL15497.1 hypothetical protein Mpal_0104 [Methanosphaerula palustris E1-9c]